jgi:hypothetical protein
MSIKNSNETIGNRNRDLQGKVIKSGNLDKTSFTHSNNVYFTEIYSRTFEILDRGMLIHLKPNFTKMLQVALSVRIRKFCQKKISTHTFMTILQND